MNGAQSDRTMRLAVRDLAIGRGGRDLARGISFSLGAGDALIVTGPNGAGKSTLLRVLAGLLPATGGAVALTSDDGDCWPTLAAASHYLGAANAMKPALTTGENLDFWQRYGGKAAMPVADALAALDMAHARDLPYAWLSTGQKRRAAIARLLLNFRPVWILDEPTSGLDSASSGGFSALLERHRETGGIIIAATHMPLGLSGVQTLEIGGGA